MNSKILKYLDDKQLPYDELNEGKIMIHVHSMSLSMLKDLYELGARYIYSHASAFIISP